MASISTADVLAYVDRRQKQGIVAARGERKGERISDVSNAEINRELTLLKRMFTLAVQARQLLHRPHIPMLEERNTRRGFFEFDQLAAVVARLPEPLQPIVQFAYITGWRVHSEILPLERRHVDFDAGEVRLDPETTKNCEGRTFPLTDDLRALLQAQQDARDARKQAGHIMPRVFWRMVATGSEMTQLIERFTKAWKSACMGSVGSGNSGQLISGNSGHLVLLI